MKYIAMSVLAAVCGTLSASALDATDACIWLDPKLKTDFVEVGSGMSGDRKVGDTSARKWQMVKIPVNIEGMVKKGDKKEAAHYITEVKMRISLVVEVPEDKDKNKEPLEVLSKEVTYVELPLNSGAAKSDMGENIVNVAVFVSPANAYKLSPKDGSLAKKLVAVAVEGSINGANCNRKKEKATESVAASVVLMSKYDRVLKEQRWWKKPGGKSGAVLAAISETPFAPNYAGMGMPATRPIYGAATDAPSGASAGLLGGGADSLVPPSGTGADADDTTTDTTDTVVTEDDSDDSKSKKKDRKNRRSSRR